jgi:hypothetical protein
MLARRTDGYDFGSSVLRCQRQREQAGVKQFTPSARISVITIDRI